MKIEYEPKHDIVNIEFLKDVEIDESVEEDGIIFDYSKDKKLVSVEVLDARKRVGKNPLDKVEETVRIGKIFEEKCEQPNKLCFERYFGKENVTYTVIVRYYKNFIEVKTAWPKKGR